MALVTPGTAVIAAEAANGGELPRGIAFWAPVRDAASQRLNATIRGAGGEGPTFMLNPWDIVVLAGTKLPGLWRVTGLPTLAVDKKKHAGADGLAITTSGYVPGPVQLEGVLWTAKQWDFFQTIAPQIWRKPTKGDSGTATAPAVTVDHPALAVWGISRVVVIGVSPPIDGPVKQTKNIKIKCIEFVAPDGVNRTRRASAAPDPRVADGIKANPPPDVTDTTIHGKKIDKRGGAE